MPGTLDNMSDRELWRLFPILLREHDPAWREDFRAERALVTGALGARRIARISHIGSTAVPGLLAKPTVDILMEIHEDVPDGAVTAALEDAGYLFSPQPDNPPPHMMFLKGYTPGGFADKVFHLHVRYPGDPDELYFRDYLRAFPEAAREYAALKRGLSGRYRHDRDAYTDAKGAFVRDATRRARALYGARYDLRHG